MAHTAEGNPEARGIRCPGCGGRLEIEETQTEDAEYGAIFVLATCRECGKGVGIQFSATQEDAEDLDDTEE
jgi:DNA-directed RNA polymerase subunit RPC12/RpoP